MFNNFRELLFDCYALAYGGWVLYHLILIALQEKVVIYEDKPWVLGLEIAATIVVIFGFLERLWGDYRGVKSKRRKNCEERKESREQVQR